MTSRNVDHREPRDDFKCFARSARGQVRTAAGFVLLGAAHEVTGVHARLARLYAAEPELARCHRGGES